MESISNFIPNLNSVSSFFPDMSHFPITLGIIAGLGHGVLQATALNINTSIFQQANDDHNAVLETAPSVFSKAIITIKMGLEIVIQPLYWELIFRDSIYTYVESNYTNAIAINFVVMPILFGALHFDPRIQASLLQPISYTSLGCMLALLRKTTGGIRSPLVAQITNNLVVGFIGGVAIVIEKARQ